MPTARVLRALGDIRRAPSIPRSALKPLQAHRRARAPASSFDRRGARARGREPRGHPRACRGRRADARRRGLRRRRPAVPRRLAARTPSAPRRGAGGEPQPAHHELLGQARRLPRRCAVARRLRRRDDYLDPAHPLQRAHPDTIEECTGERGRALRASTAAVPVHATSPRGRSRAASPRVAPGDATARAAHDARSLAEPVGDRRAGPREHRRHRDASA